MTRREKVWLVIALLFALVNLGGALYAGAFGEWIHMGIHIALLLAAEWVVWRLLQRRALRY